MTSCKNRCKLSLGSGLACSCTGVLAMSRSTEVHVAEISFKEEVGGPPDLEATAVSRAEVSQRRKIADSDLLRWLWYDRSVRAQVLGTFAALNLVAGLAAAIIVIYNGQRAIEAELTASVEVAERFVGGTVEWFTRDASRTLHIEDLAVRLSLRHPRHV